MSTINIKFSNIQAGESQRYELNGLIIIRTHCGDATSSAF